jgi:heme/copper-type cytochrome/quinol oxidase subunit 2
VKLVSKILIPLLALCAPMKSLACAACYGKVDGAMADGMNWGIFTLMGVIVPVLGGFLAFFIYLIRRSEALANTDATPQNNSTNV